MTTFTKLVVCLRIHALIFWYVDLEKVNVTLTVERFESSGVTITLHWWLTVEYYYYQSYDITVVPQLSEQSLLNFTDTTHISVQLKVFYNTSYNVTLSAIPLCGGNKLTSSMQELYFNLSKYKIYLVALGITLQKNCMN